MSPESLPCKNGHQPIRGELPATQTSAGAESQLFQVPEQRGGTQGPTRVQGEVTGETLKGQKTHPGCGGAGRGGDSTRGRAGAAGDLGQSAWLLPNRPARKDQPIPEAGTRAPLSGRLQQTPRRSRLARGPSSSTA